MKMNFRLASGVAVIAISAALVGCSGPEELINRGVEKAVEKGIEGATGAEIDVDAGGGASLPSDFPTGLPLPDGKLYSTFKIEDSFQLSYELDTTAEGERIIEIFRNDSAYEVEAEQDLGEMFIGSYVSDSWRVMLTLANGEPAQFSYVVAPVEAS